MRLSTLQKRKIEELTKKYNLKLILLFGSQVLRKTHKESDVDLAFLSGRNLSFEEEILLNTEFCPIFKTDKVDTVNLRMAPPLLLKEILDNHKILYQKNPLDFSIFEVLVLQKYSEAKPLFEITHEGLEKIIKSYDK